ncbi:MAG: hypothetical protein JKY94_11120 [Rhodobacteraceae bacterium]|nr:hypothetical protein [Paracoccaceae bacterium]
MTLTALHVFGGGPDVHVPLLESNASDVLKGFVSVVWHGTTATLLLCSCMLFIAARNENYRYILTGLVIANYLAFAGLFLFYGATRLGTVFLMLPWIGFVTIAVIASIGLALDKSTDQIVVQT